jgi:hypothetical protein
MMVKYGVYDGEDLKFEMDAIKQEPRQWVQLYYDGLECLFVRGRILDVERRIRFLAHLGQKSGSCVWCVPMLTWTNYWQ